MRKLQSMLDDMCWKENSLRWDGNGIAINIEVNNKGCTYIKTLCMREGDIAGQWGKGQTVPDGAGTGDCPCAQKIELDPDVIPYIRLSQINWKEMHLEICGSHCNLFWNMVGYWQSVCAKVWDGHCHPTDFLLWRSCPSCGSCNQGTAFLT